MNFWKLHSALAFPLLTALSLSGQVPQGTILPAQLLSSIDTRRSEVGDRVPARLMQDISLPGFRIPAGARLIGQIVEVRPDRVSWRFDRLLTGGESIPIRTNLRALASPVEIHDAQLPSNSAGGDRGSAELDWNTIQVGGDVVYGRRGGVVTEGDEVVGHSLFGDGVLGMPVAGRGCRGTVGANAPQAFWLFSASACGLYGYPDFSMIHAGRTDPVGVITITSTGRLKIRTGSGMLLRALGN